MSTTESKIQLTLAYDQTSFTRSLSMNVDDSIAAAAGTVKSKIDAINASLAGGTADSLKNFFLADDYDGVGGTLSRIKDAKITIVEETVIF